MLRRIISLPRSAVGHVQLVDPVRNTGSGRPAGCLPCPDPSPGPRARRSRSTGAELRVLDERQRRLVGRGLGSVEVVLQPDRDRRPRSPVACPGARPERIRRWPSSIRRRSGSRALARCAPDADDRVRVGPCRPWRGPSSEPAGRVFTLKPARCRRRPRRGPRVQQVEHANEEERVVGLTGPRLAARRRTRGRVEQVAVVVRHRGRADVGRCPTRHPRASASCRCRGRSGSGRRSGRSSGPVVQRRDRARVVEERVRVPVLAREDPAVRDVGLRVVVVVDVDVVARTPSPQA